MLICVFLYNKVTATKGDLTLFNLKLLPLTVVIAENIKNNKPSKFKRIYLRTHFGTEH